MSTVQWFLLISAVAALLRATDRERRIWQWMFLAAAIVWAFVGPVFEVMMYGD